MVSCFAVFLLLFLVFAFRYARNRCCCWPYSGKCWSLRLGLIDRRFFRGFNNSMANAKSIGKKRRCGLGTRAHLTSIWLVANWEMDIECCCLVCLFVIFSHIHCCTQHWYAMKTLRRCCKSAIDADDISLSLSHSLIRRSMVGIDMHDRNWPIKSRRSQKANSVICFQRTTRSWTRNSFRSTRNRFV